MQDAGLDIAIISHSLNIYILIFHHPPKSIAFSSTQGDRWLTRLQAMEIWCYRQVPRYSKKINNLFKQLCQMQSSLPHFVSCWLCLMYDCLHIDSLVTINDEGKKRNIVVSRMTCGCTVQTCEHNWNSRQKKI